ncbi:MAG: nucleotidyltransferase family protein [Rickettsiales bacterium]|jgi:MurNAc alpha-1-phosphate uridylyltransferase|nr:nucleotidyltransferase family protein [Rickettsiales bacterium]
MIKQAMILAAGMGSRMEHLTADIPKPMLLVHGTSLIERHLNYLHQHNIEKVVINTHYKGDILKNFVKTLPLYKKIEIHFSHEDELLGTAGGVKNALKFFGKDPFFVINSDAIYLDDDSNHPSLSELEANWQPNNMTILILLAKKDKAFGYYGKGDFDLNDKKQLSLNKESGEFIHAGMTILDYRIFEKYPEKTLEFYPIYLEQMSQGKLCGVIFQGKWFHIGSLKAYNEVPKI